MARVQRFGFLVAFLVSVLTSFSLFCSSPLFAAVPGQQAAGQSASGTTVFHVQSDAPAPKHKHKKKKHTKKKHTKKRHKSAPAPSPSQNDGPPPGGEGPGAGGPPPAPGM